MSQTDPVADMLTMIRNANHRSLKKIVAPHSKFKEGVAHVLKEEGYLGDYKVVPDEVAGEKKKTLHLYLKYGPDNEKVITKIVRVSKPGGRVFRGIDKVGKVLDSLGIAVLSTSKGIMSDRKARKLRVGGEVICKVW